MKPFGQKKPLYKREGRRFVRIEQLDNSGMYYQEDGTFQKEHDDKSIGMCIVSDFKQDVIISLKEHHKVFSEIDITQLPTELELLTAFTFYNDELALSPNLLYWISIDKAIGSIAAWSYGSGVSSGGVGYLYVSSSPGIRTCNYGSRLFRKAIRISKT